MNDISTQATWLSILTPIITALSTFIIAFLQLQSAKLARKAALEAEATRAIAVTSVAASHANAVTLTAVSAQIGEVKDSVTEVKESVARVETASSPTSTLPSS